jgi:predicted metal-binding protein
MDREYYLKNRDKLLQQSRERYLNKKQELLEYQREYRKKNRKLVTEKNRNKRKDRLLKAIDMLGGKCNRCNTTYEPCVYDFHHTDPAEKDFTIGENMLVGEERFFNEIKKCVLLCANCHRLTHKEI